MFSKIPPFSEQYYSAITPAKATQANSLQIIQ